MSSTLIYLSNAILVYFSNVLPGITIKKINKNYHPRVLKQVLQLYYENEEYDRHLDVGKLILITALRARSVTHENVVKQRFGNI